MKTFTKMTIAGSAILSILTLSSTASATEWTSKPLHVDGNPENEQLYAVTSDTTALTFVCKAKKLRAAVATTNNNAESVLDAYSETRRRIQRPVELTIAGDVVDASSWTINPKRDIFVTPNRKITAKLYNAAIQQAPVSIQRKGRESINLTFPLPNEDFVEFGSACGIGNVRKK